MEEKSHILKVLKSVKTALERHHYVKIKNLSNHIIHHASIQQDPEVISLAVIIYSLSKIMEREDYRKYKNWPSFYKNFLKNIDDMITALNNNDIKRFRDEILSNNKIIQKLSGKLKPFIQEAFRKAKVNKASRIYEHGISMEKTAKMLDITIWELSEYAGKTRIGDVNLGITKPIKERLKLAEQIFNQCSYIIFDSGPLINFSMNSSLHILKRLKKEFRGEFLITKEVKEEVIDHPLTVKRFKLEGLRLKKLYDEKIFHLADLTNQQVSELKKTRNYIMNLANTTFKAKGKNINLLHKGEAAALALSTILKTRCAIVVDERTTRILCENPENLRKLLEKKLKTSIKANKKNYEFFQKFNIIRSIELAYIAHKKNLFDLKGPKVLEAILYGLKYKGASVSEEEIQTLIR